MLSVSFWHEADIEEARIGATPNVRFAALRDSVTMYDAAYVVLAEILDAPLITCDAKLARSHGHEARMELLE